MADILPPVAEDDRMLSGLVYPLWPLLCPIIFYGSKRSEPYVHFHALQSLALGVSSIAAVFVLGLITWIFMYVLSFRFLAGTVGGVLGLVTFFVAGFLLLFYLTVIMYLGWRAASGAFFRLPFLGRWAETRMQMNLGITAEDYASGVFGVRRPDSKLTAFDYEKLLPPEPAEPTPERPGDGFVYNYYEDGASEEPAQPYYDEDTGEMIYSGSDGDGSIEFYKDGPVDIPSLSDAYPPSPASATDAPAAPRGPSPLDPRTATSSSSRPSDGFTPLTSTINRSPERQAPAPVVVPTEDTSAPSSADSFRPGVVPGRKERSRFQWGSLSTDNLPGSPSAGKRSDASDKSDGFKAW